MTKKNEYISECCGNQHKWIQKQETFICSCILLHQLCFPILLPFIVYKQWEQFITTSFTSQHFHFAITCAWGAYRLGTLFEVLLTGFSKEQSSFIHLSIKQKALLSDSFSYFQPINKRHKILQFTVTKERKGAIHQASLLCINVNRSPTKSPTKGKGVVQHQHLEGWLATQHPKLTTVLYFFGKRSKNSFFWP